MNFKSTTRVIVHSVTPSVKQGVLLLLLCSGFFSYAQQPYNKRQEFLKANSHWAFGDGAGLDFNGGGPVAIKTARGSDVRFSEGGSAVSDPVSGKLLFYSNGGSVWNAEHKIMPNGSGLLGSSLYAADTLWQTSTRQGVCIVPVINDPYNYYLFSLSGISSLGAKPEGTLFYNIVDMRLDSGRGDIVQGKKNITVDRDTLTEGVIAVPGNKCDVWIITHHWRRHEFRTYHITKDGVDTVPVISTASKGFGTLGYALGTLAVSPDRSKIVITGNTTRTIAAGVLIAEFDPATGKVTDPMIINNKLSPMGACFSADNSKLYVSAGSTINTGIGQFDLAVYDSTTIANSFTVVSNKGSDPIVLYNDTIYFIKGDSTNYISRINSPNLAGTACNVQKDVIRLLDSTDIGQGPSLHNNVVYSLPSEDTIHIAPFFDSIGCLGERKLSAASGFREYQWDDGSVSPDRTITAPGTYWVLFRDYCFYRVDTFIVSEVVDLVPPVITINVNILGTIESYSSYQWIFDGSVIPGANGSTYTVSENGDYQVIVTNDLGCVDTSDIYEVTNFSSIEGRNALGRQIRVYPNPAAHTFYIDAPVAVNIQLTDLAGKLLREQAGATSMSLEALPKGIYLLRIADREGELLKTEKLVKVE